MYFFSDPSCVHNHIYPKTDTKLVLTLSPILTALMNGMAETPQIVAVAKASLNSCIMVDGWSSSKRFFMDDGVLWSGILDIPGPLLT